MIQSFFDFLDIIIEKVTSYLRQRERVKESVLSTVVDHLVRENLNDRPEWIGYDSK